MICPSQIIPSQGSWPGRGWCLIQQGRSLGCWQGHLGQFPAGHPEKEMHVNMLQGTSSLGVGKTISSNTPWTQWSRCNGVPNLKGKQPAND